MGEAARKATPVYRSCRSSVAVERKKKKEEVSEA